MALTLHHLYESRSFRVLWLLEEAGIPYNLVTYQRDPTTRLAPESLKVIHPLGKSPVIVEEGKVITESGAIVEYLINRYAPHLAPAKEDRRYSDYLQWLHFAESSAMVPVLLKLFNQFELQAGTSLRFLESYAEREFDRVFSFLNQSVASGSFIVGDNLTGADIMLGFVVSRVTSRADLAERFPNLQDYADRLQALDSWKRASNVESASLNSHE